MAKVTDYAEILTEVNTQLEEKEWSILDYTDQQTAAILVSNIYLTYDVLKAYGQDLDIKFSIICSMSRISVISGSSASCYTFTYPLCDYVDLADDIAEILMVLQAAIDRMESFQ